MIELRALGGLRLGDSADGREILSVLARVKPPGLLLYLALSPPKLSHGRDKLFALLWPGSSTEKARNSLNQALHILRRGLGPGVIEATEGGDLFLEAGALWCDVAAFDRTLAAGHAREALELYSGHLWDPSDVGDCPAFERWLDGERERLRRLAVGAAVSVAQELERDGGVADAAGWLRRARDWAPYDEAVVRPLLKLLWSMGDRAAAVREYDAYEECLADDLELTPSTGMSELITEIRSSTVGPEAAGGEPPALPTPEREGKAFAKQPQGDSGPDPAPETTELTEPIRARPRASWRTRGRAAAATVVLGAIVVVGATVIRNGRVDTPPLDPTRVLVDIFQNETGDPSLDAVGRMATDRVTAGLTLTTFVDVVSLGTRLLSREPVVSDSGLLERADLRALARANGTGTVVWGSYYLERDSLHFLAHVTSAATGEELATIEPVSGPVDDHLATVERLRDRVMTTLATITDPRLAKWMRYASQPPTFEAYTEFVEGIELHTNGKPGEAIPYFLRAAALDSDFTMASLWAASAYGNSGQPALTDSISQALNGRRDQLAPLDRLLLDHQLAWYRRDYRGALEAMRQFVEIAPGSEFLYTAGMTALQLNRPAEAIEFLTQADPESGWLRGSVHYWRTLTQAYHDVGDYERELEAANRMRRLHPESPIPLQVEMRILAALGRIEELGALIPGLIQGYQGGGTYVFTWFKELHAHGYPTAASDLADRTPEWFEGRAYDWRQDPGQSFIYATLLSHAGRWDEAQAILEDVVMMPVVMMPGWTIGGHNNAALRLAYVLASQGRRDQSFRAVGLTPYSNFPLVLAWVEAALGERVRAMELLREGGFELDPHRRRWLGKWESMRDYPPFVEEFLRSTG